MEYRDLKKMKMAKLKQNIIKQERNCRDGYKERIEVKYCKHQTVQKNRKYARW